CCRLLCSMRRCCEINGRSDPPLPIDATNEADYELVPATFGLLSVCTRAVVSGIFNFAESMFPEFVRFSRQEKWALAVRFHNRFIGLDGCYRAEKIFPDDMGKCMITYTSYVSADAADGFFDDCCGGKVNIEEAKKVMKSFISRLVPPIRHAMRRMDIDSVEFHALIVLTFWFADCMQMREGIAQVGEKYRQAVLSELQAHYRHELKQVDYASRIGELFMLIFLFDCNTDLKESSEIYRLLGVFEDNDFVYRL
ncbi:hypothetical protein PFISCL1PPCAC_13083, partial [Pristionchus fissidentatus]